MNCLRKPIPNNGYIFRDTQYKTKKGPKGP